MRWTKEEQENAQYRVKLKRALRKKGVPIRNNMTTEELEKLTDLFIDK